MCGSHTAAVSGEPSTAMSADLLSGGGRDPQACCCLPQSGLILSLLLDQENKESSSLCLSVSDEVTAQELGRVQVSLSTLSWARTRPEGLGSGSPASVCVCTHGPDFSLLNKALFAPVLNEWKCSQYAQCKENDFIMGKHCKHFVCYVSLSQ